MSDEAKGLLLVLADPPATMEEEFNDWYDTEHLPERQAVAGFETALRFRSVGDGPAYMAVYDLQNLAVLNTDAYLAVSGSNFSPWTRRVTARSHPARWTARQVWPGQSVTGPCARLVLLRFREMGEGDAPHLAEKLGDCFAGQGLIQLRIFACDDPAPHALVTLIELGAGSGSLQPGTMGEFAKRLDLCATYRPHRP